MPILGITGGVATGKSSFVRELSSLMTAELFDADVCARQLLTQDAEVLDQVRRHFGPAVCSEHGSVDRKRLRELVFSNPERRRLLESIVHPRIRERWMSLASASRTAETHLIVDIPLLFETSAFEHFDRVVVVACSASVQRERLLRIRGLDEATAAGMLSAQLDLSWKMKQCHQVIWNDFSLSLLAAQAALFAASVMEQYG